MSTDVMNRKGEGRGKGTDGGSERVEEVGETDHLRSVGHRHKPVGEGQSLLDSVLQRDKKRDQERGMTTGWEMVKTDTDTKKNIERMLKSKTEICLSVEKPSRGEITQGVGEMWVVISLSSSKCLFAPDVCIKY